MEELPASRKRRMRFTVRETLLVMVIVALGFGWHRFAGEAEARTRRLRARLMWLPHMQRLSDSREESERERAWTEQQSKLRVLHGIDLKGASLRSVTIDAGQEAAFQKMVFDVCDLSGATLIAGGASFQEARFEGALLGGAKLSGGGSSFQLAVFDLADLSEAHLAGNFQGASFARATLTGAQLIGDGTAFQLANFAQADLRGAKLVGGGASFQGMDIDGAQFEGADLSAIETQNLASCHFATSPTYDDATKFPAGFDPKLEGWKRAE
ncbi:MAG TPA: pentapeptide repeat-containing protein [Lacipirellula sp.]